MNAITVATIGEILFDVYEEHKKPGGSSLNVSLHLFKQGVQTNFVSAVGKDEEGKELLNHLQEQGFSSRYIQLSALPTGKVIVKLDAEKQATYTINEHVAWDDINLTAELMEMVQKADAFVYCSLTCRNAKSRNTIYELLEQANLKIFDINLRAPFYEPEVLKHLLAKADILKINEDEMNYLCPELSLPNADEDALKELSKMFHLKLICLTLGAKGAKVLYQDEIYTHPGYRVEVDDTVGAGDSFLATFIRFFLQGAELKEVLDQACKVGAFVASKAGANPDYPEHLFA